MARRARTELFVGKHSGGMFSIENMGISTGNRVFVDSVSGTDSAGRGNNPSNPVATLDYAVGLTTANQGDIIYVMENHAETITTAAPVAIDVDGVTIKCLGEGSDRPTFTLGTNAAATITVSAANVSIDNMLVSNTVDNCTSMMTVSGDDFSFTNGETRDTGAVEAALVWTITGDRWHINNYTHIGEGSGDQAVACFQPTGTDRGILENFNVDSAGSTAVFSSLSTANTLMRIHDGYFIQREAAVGVAMSLLSADTGFVGPNIHIRLVDDNTDPFAAIDSASNVNFLGPITVAAGDDEAGLDISHGLAVAADQNLVQTPWGAAREVTESFQPAASLVPIFTPSVGKCLIVGLWLQIDTTMGAAADFIVQSSTTAAGAMNICAITQVDGEADETILGLTGNAADVLSLGTARCASPIVVDGADSGVTIGVLGSEANVATGHGIWHCLYIPLERGALITAAA
ncbi:hypothetical protein LCGC14_0714570 [marine sediment metagenome]|uniref:Uncharacterized protein n=1 Tax=marine sediment metagenome TaxID=412755 RepID=A0A0F9TLK3_9ZZZZ|nr:hypothetical protein [Phycisphaerae bacterium]